MLPLNLCVYVCGGGCGGSSGSDSSDSDGVRCRNEHFQFNQFSSNMIVQCEH